jgi:hypothetical protein
MVVGRRLGELLQSGVIDLCDRTGLLGNRLRLTGMGEAARPCKQPRPHSDPNPDPAFRCHPRLRFLAPRTADYNASHYQLQTVMS